MSTLDAPELTESYRVVEPPGLASGEEPFEVPGRPLVRHLDEVGLREHDRRQFSLHD